MKAIVSYYDMSGDNYRYTGIDPEAILERYAPPIEIAPRESQTVAHLTSAAILMMAGEMVFLQPETDAIMPNMQDYRIIALSGMATSLNMYARDKERFLDDLAVADGMHEAQGLLPDGMAILRPGEEAVLGRRTMPQLLFGQHVPAVHTRVTIDEQGVSVRDIETLKPTKLYLSHADAHNIGGEIEVVKVSDATRDSLYRAFSGLCIGDGLSYYIDGVEFDASYVPVSDSPYQMVELVVQSAEGYADLHPQKGYQHKRFRIDPTRPGIEIFNFSDHSERVPGIRKASGLTQLTQPEATALFRLAANF